MEREIGVEEKEEKGWDEGWEWRRRMIKGWKKRRKRIEWGQNVSRRGRK